MKAGIFSTFLKFCNSFLKIPKNRSVARIFFTVFGVKIITVKKKLVTMLGEYNGNAVTYAGGIHSYEDIADLRFAGKNRVHVTIGSALDLFGGNLSFHELLTYFKE